MNIVVNDRLVNYQITGKGPAVVLLHGWGDNSKTFAQLTKTLQPKFSVVSVDLPGFGGSEAPKETFNLEKYAQFVDDFVAKVGLHSVYAYIGHSNGGAILIRGVAAGILSSDKLVLIAGAGVRANRQGRKRFWRMAAKAAKLPTSLLPKTTQAKIKRKVYKAIGSDLFVAEHMQDTFRRVVEEDVVHEAAMIQQPTLLLYGTHDRSTPVAFGKKYASQIENSKLVVIEGADHFLHHTHPEKISSLVAEFLDK